MYALLAEYFFSKSHAFPQINASLLLCILAIFLRGLTFTCVLIFCSHFYYEIFLTSTTGASVFQNVGPLKKYLSRAEEVYADFIEYKRKVPVYGGILLNAAMDKVCHCPHESSRFTLLCILLSASLHCNNPKFFCFIAYKYYVCVMFIGRSVYW
jgi:hypothetical protein